MHDHQFLRDILVLLAVVIPLLFIAERLKFPSVIGFMLAGILIGPSVFGWVSNQESITQLSEVGIVLLLFSIGLEFSIQKIAALRNYLLIVGGGQVILTIGLAWLLSALAGMDHQKGIVIGFLISLSSTAIMIKILQQRKELDTPTGRLTLSISLFQDLAIIPMVLILPLLGSGGPIDRWEVTQTLALSIMGIGIILVGARLVIPRLLDLVVKTNNRELFLVTILFVVVLVAWVSSLVGLSLALGAFLAGLIVSESDYSHQVLADVFPMRDALVALFFISIGMMLNLTNLVADWEWVLLISTGIILSKSLIVAAFTWALAYPIRIGLAVGLMVAQIGEFSFVLAGTALTLQILTESDYQIFLGASILTMLMAPFLITQANPIGNWLHQKFHFKPAGKPAFRRLSRLVTTGNLESTGMKADVKGHVIIIGYGKTGQHLSHVLKETGIPFVISELQHVRFSQARSEGHPVVFGDATTQEILDELKIRKASVLVISTGDVYSTTRIVQVSRTLNKGLHIIARTRYINDLGPLYTAGADQVIPEEFETSIEIFSRTLRYFHIPRNIIASQIAIIRKERYGTLEGQSVSKETLGQLPYILAATTTESAVILEGSPVSGISLGDSGLTSRAGIHVIAVIRDGASVNTPSPDWVFAPGDVIVMVGNHAEIDAALGILGTDLAS
ncbi:MAG: cation:proton antiporter [Bacteroidetes bacterium]|nr:cation:proton antiporter [Bacteroidota bacterium]